MNILTTVEEIKAEAKKIDMVTPFMIMVNAEICEWLSHKNRPYQKSLPGEKSNRPIKPKKVEGLINQIRRGEWNPYVRAIAINASCDWLIDGQHRVAAHLGARVFNCLNILNIVPDKDALDYADKCDIGGSVRSVADQMGMHGFTNNTWWQALCNRHDKIVGNGFAVKSTSETIEFRKKYESLDFLGWQLKLDGSQLRVPTEVYVAAIVLWDYNHDFRDRLGTFISNLAKNTTGESPRLLKFRNDTTAKRIKGNDLFWSALHCFYLDLIGRPGKKTRPDEATIEEYAKKFGISTNKTRKVRDLPTRTVMAIMAHEKPISALMDSTIEHVA